MSKLGKFLFGRPQPPVTLVQTAAAEQCTNCGKPLTGHYCADCGEKKIDKHDMSVAHFLGHTLHEFTHFDSRLLRTLKDLLFKPGRLTEENFAGHRKRYMNPMQLFIILNLIYFLVGRGDTFTTPLAAHIVSPYGHLASQMVQQKIHAQGISYKEYEKGFNHSLKGQAKSLVIVMVPMFAIITGLLYYRQKRYFVEHLTFSVHFYSFLLALLGVGMYVIFIPLSILIALAAHITGKGIPNLDNDSFVTALLSTLLFAYIFVAIKRVFRQSNFQSFLNAGILTIFVWTIVQAYRFVLFFTTYYGLLLHE